MTASTADPGLRITFLLSLSLQDSLWAKFREGHIVIAAEILCCLYIKPSIDPFHKFTLLLHKSLTPMLKILRCTPPQLHVQ